MYLIGMSMLIQTELNENYGFFPYSTFVKLEITDDLLNNIEYSYSLITKKSCNDIIFYGNILNNDVIDFLSPRLMCEGYYVSYYSNKLLYSNLASRIILKTDCFTIYSNIKFLSRLSVKDIVIVDAPTIKDIKQVRNIIFNNKLNFTLFYNGDKIKQEDVSSEQFYMEYPFFPSKLKIDLEN